MNNQYITVNLIPNLSAPAVACVSQYDVGRPLVFRVYNGVTSADLTDTTAVAVGTKKSGLGFSVTGTISGNTVTFSTTLEMTQESGMIPAEIRFSKTGEDIGTANFTLAVEPSPHLEGTTDGTTETMGDLQSQLDALDERVEALEGGGGLTEGFIHALQELFEAVAIWDSSKLPNPQAKIDDLSDYIGGGGDDPTPPSPEITITYSNGVMTISGVSPITGASFANGILTLT